MYSGGLRRVEEGMQKEKGAHHLTNG
jgi:hypothetical protein